MSNYFMNTTSPSFNTPRNARLLAALVIAAGLAGCHTPPDTPASSAGRELPAPASGESAMSCDSSKAQWAVGKIADEALLARAKNDAGANLARILRPDMAVTMEYRAERLNLRVDETGKVLDVSCG